LWKEKRPQWVLKIKKIMKKLGYWAKIIELFEKNDFDEIERLYKNLAGERL